LFNAATDQAGEKQNDAKSKADIKPASMGGLVTGSTQTVACFASRQCGNAAQLYG
jgi:hypothetical protein